MAKKKNKDIEYLYKVKQIKIKKNHQYFSLFKDLSHKANNLFNRTNYLIRQEYFENKKFLDSAKITKLYKENKGEFYSEAYYSLPSQTAVVVTQKLEEAWKSFFKLLDNPKTKPNAKIPKYKKKGGQLTFTFTKQQISKSKVNEGKICVLPKLHGVELDLEYSEDIQEIQVVPNKNHFMLNEREGITLIEQQESYTSGTSVLDKELPNQEFYDSSRRVSRGMFVSNKGVKVNADINGAYQTLKKFWVKNKINRNIEFVGLNPMKFSV